MFIKQIYSMVVCFITTIILLITLAITINALITLFLPEYSNKSELIKYSTNEQYLRYLEQHDTKENDSLYKQLKDVSEEKITEKRIIYKNDYIQTIKAQSTSTIISCLTWIIVSFIFFIIHWKFYKIISRRDELSK